MSRAWTWIKGAGGWLVSGSSSLYLYGAIGAAAVGGAAWWHSAKVESGYQRGYSVATGEHQAAVNRSLLLQAERIATLSNELTEALNAYSITSNALASARTGAEYRGHRVRAVAAGPELEQRLGAAECGVARTFGAGAFRTAAACRDDVAALGLGTGGLVESAASAHYEHARAEALMRFSMPRTPFKKPTPETQP
jgi:hypothetical protein